MRRNPDPSASTAPPRAGDLVSCVSCGRTNVHDRVLALSRCCGRRVAVHDRGRSHERFLKRLVARFAPFGTRGWLA